MIPTRDQIAHAADQIRPYVRRTPVIDVDGLTLKLECLQHAGSFKVRAAFHAVLSQPQRPRRLVAASGGNHGLAVAYVGARLGIPVEVYVPQIVSPVKAAAIQRQGATAVVVGENFAAAFAASREAASLEGVLAIHAYDDPATLAGQGTLGLEVAEQVPEVEQVVVAVGGGGLIGGVASWFGEGSGVAVTAVEPERCPSMHEALRAGHPVSAPVGGLAADALGASVAGAGGLAALRASHHASVLVDDDAIAEARQWLWDSLRVVTEPAGATALAAVRAGLVETSGRTAVVLCGANTDPSDLIR